MEFSLIVPLWNEGKNIVSLVESIDTDNLPRLGMKELILVNNGSSDDTREKMLSLAQRFDWIKPVDLAVNVNYGGGVYEGFRHASAEVVAYIPGDLQVMPDDVLVVWNAFKTAEGACSLTNKNLFVKGCRTRRLDGFQTRFVSRVYTFLANRILDLRVKDLNGLPKMFHKRLLMKLPEEKMRTFVFDAQLLAAARDWRFEVIEVPVTFHARRQGISSWSGKRIKVYRESFRSMMRLRQLRKAEPAGFVGADGQPYSDVLQENLPRRCSAN
jgi:glycosyltransferase involved in cell wall biosynthesis